MELLIIAFFAVVLVFLGIRKLWESATSRKLPEPGPQQMVFMGAALEVSDNLGIALIAKVEQRSLDIAKADGRFLVTPNDMHVAYQEIIREEHM